LFGEFNIPFSKELEVTAAGRADSYSGMGSSFNPKLGVRYQPMKELLIRGSASTGFRAPSLYDAFAANVFTNTASVTDRVTGKTSQFTAQYGGNPDLKPETSKTISLGAVAEPQKGLTLSADIWAIKVEHTIGSLPDTTVFGSDQFNYLFYRNANGGLSQGGNACPGPSCGYVDLRSQNLGGLNTSGLDLNANYRVNIAGSGTISFSAASTYVDKYEYQDYEGGPWIQNIGVYEGSGPVFKWKHKASVVWSHGEFSTGLAGNYKSGYADQATSANKKLQGYTGAPVGEYVTYDAYTTWSPSKAAAITFGVRNLTDVEPPTSYQVATFQAGYDPRFSDPIGRTFYLRGTFSF
jgi:iron complex outermembrane receptor protein